jgi:hypothetical protein
MGSVCVFSRERVVSTYYGFSWTLENGFAPFCPSFIETPFRGGVPRLPADRNAVMPVPA